MSNLFRFNLKKNTGVFFNKNKNLIKKFYLSYRQKKNTKLLNEFNGLSWYFKKLKKIFKYNYLIASNNVNYFEYSLIKGNKFKFWDRFIFEKNKIRAVINHYKKVWPKNSYVPFHGDLTLENILFLNSKEVIFIDWENYKKKEEWGLDICYFLISLIVLPNLNNKKKISKEDMRLFKALWNENFFRKKYNYLNKPIDYIISKQNSKNNFFFKITPEMKKQIYSEIN